MKAHELAEKIAIDIKRERELVYFGENDMRNTLEKHRNTAFKYFKVERSARVRRALSDNGSNTAPGVIKSKKVTASFNYREDADGKLVRY